MRVIFTCIFLTALILAISIFTPVQAAAPAESSSMEAPLKPDPVPPKGSPAADPGAAMRMSHGSEGAQVHGGMMEAMRDGDMSKGMVRGCMMKSMAAGFMMSNRNFNDRAYLSAMIAHHEAALNMADEVLKNGKDPEVKKWAEAVKAAQEPEIKQMSGWLTALGGTDEAAAGMMRQSMSAMMGKPMGNDADHNFVSMMIGHHAGAVDMAVSAIIGSSNEDVIKLSRNIVATQLDEILAYKDWLAKHQQP